MKNKTLILTCWLLTAGLLFSLQAQHFDIYVSDGGNFDNPPWQILKFDENGENGEVFISNHLAWPQDIFFIESNNTVLVSNLKSNVISKFDASTGQFLEEFATGLSGPTRMKLGPGNLLYVLQWSANTRVKRFQLDGTFVDDFTKTNTGTAIGLDWDAGGNLYVSSYGGNYIRKYSPGGEDLGNFISSGLDGPTNIWFGENGDLFVNNWNTGVVKRFDSQGNPLGNFITGIARCEGVDFFPNGNIAIGAGAASAVKVYSPDGAYLKDLVPPGTLNLLLPNAVVFREKDTSPVKEVYRETTIVTPSAGHLFRLKDPGMFSNATVFEVFSASGMLVHRFNFTGESLWDASNQAAGIYYLLVKLPDGSMAKQKVLVQH